MFTPARLQHSIRCVLALSLGLAGAALGTHVAAAQEPAVGPLRRAAEQDRDAPGAQLALGHALIRAGRLKEAEQAMARHVRASHGSIEALYEAARVPFAAGDSKRARAACQALTRKSPDHVLTHACNARAFLIWRRSSRALEHVQAARAVAPSHPEALLALADLQRITSEVDAAQQTYEQLIAAHPGNTAARLGLALTLSLKQQDEAAIAALRGALQVDPEDPELQFELGSRLEGEEAVRLLRAAVAGRPNWPAAQLTLASTQRKAGDPGGAANRLKTLLAHDRNNGAARAERGLALLELDRTAEAEAELRKAVALQPNDYDSSFALARVYERTGRHEDAFTQYRYTADLKRENAAPLIAAAELGLSLQRPVFAAALLQRALERAPRSAHALALYAETLAARDDRPAARDYYQRALQGEGPLDRATIQKNLAALK